MVLLKYGIKYFNSLILLDSKRQSVHIQ